MNETIRLTCFFSHGFNISRLQKKLINSLVSKKTVVPRRWGNQNRKFDIKRLDKGQIAAVTGFQSRRFAR